MATNMPRKNTTATWNREDRDLLVELRTTLAAVQNDIKEIKDGTAAKLRELEVDKISRADVTRIQVGIQETLNEHKDDIKAACDDIEDLKATRVEYRTQMRTWGIVWGVITFLIPILLTLYLN
jgi:hypothetical protein